MPVSQGTATTHKKRQSGARHEVEMLKCTTNWHELPSKVQKKKLHQSSTQAPPRKLRPKIAISSTRKENPEKYPKL